MTTYKKCTRCGEEKPFYKFYKDSYSKDGLYSSCKKCKDDARKVEWDRKYLNSEHGFVTERIGSIFKPSSCKKRGLWPTVTKERVWELYHEHKKKYGPNCIYCDKEWTYTRTIFSRNEGHTKRGKPCYTNFSIDRFDNSETYTEKNIVFCCMRCNDEKHNISLKMVERINELKNEME